jgi:hypothetical protein
MITYETKTITNKFKIGNNSYDVKIELEYGDKGPTVDVKVNSDTNLNVRVVNLGLLEVHTAIREITNILDTLSHVNFAPTPVAVAPVAAPAVGNDWSPFSANIRQ